jgi:hypothetical protein
MSLTLGKKEREGGKLETKLEITKPIRKLLKSGGVRVVFFKETHQCPKERTPTSKMISL